MKKVLLLVACFLLLAASVSASPLTDYSQGKGAIDLSIRPNLDIDLSGSSYDGKSGNFDGSITFGLGNNFAFQFASQKADSKSIAIAGSAFGATVNATASAETTGNQFNLLYKIDKNVSVFVGYTNAKTDIPVAGTVTYGGTTISGSGTLGGKTINGYQLGFIGSAPLGDKMTGYAVAGFGNKLENLEIGVSYALATNTELNVFYKSMKYKDQELNDLPGSKFDVKAAGLGAGVTFKF